MPLDPIGELERFLSDASPRSVEDPDENASTNEMPNRGVSSTAVVPSKRASAKSIVFDLTGEYDQSMFNPDAVKLAIEDELRDLNNFTGLPVDCRLPTPIAEFEADMMLMEMPPIPKPGASRALPKNTVKSKSKAAAKPKATPGPKAKAAAKQTVVGKSNRKAVAPKAMPGPKAKAAAKETVLLAKSSIRGVKRVLKSSAVRLVGSKAWHGAKTAALRDGLSKAEACRRGRVAADKARKAFRAAAAQERK